MWSRLPGSLHFRRVPALLALALALAGGFEAAWSGRLLPALYLFFLVMAITMGAGRVPPPLSHVPLRRPILLAAAAVLGPMEAIALLVVVTMGTGQRRSRLDERAAAGDFVATSVTIGLLAVLHQVSGEQAWASTLGLVTLAWLAGLLVDRLFSARDPQQGHRQAPTGLARSGSRALLQEYLAAVAMAVPLSQLTLMPGSAAAMALLASLAVGALLVSAAEKRIERFHRESLRLRAGREGLRSQQLGLARALMAGVSAHMGRDAASSVRVAGLSRAIAGFAGLSADEAGDVELAALLRDSGFLFLPARAEGGGANVTGQALQEHVVDGCSLLSAAGLAPALVEAVYAHHERWDGTGYPRRLAGTSIPVGARILAMAELLDSHRLEAPETDPALVRACLRDAAGKSLDPGLCDQLAPHVEALRQVSLGASSSPASEPGFTFLQARSRHRAMLRDRVDRAIERVSALLESCVVIDDRLFELMSVEIGRVLPLQHLALLATGSEAPDGRLLASTGMSLSVANAIQLSTMEDGVRVPGSVVARVPGEDVVLVATSSEDGDDFEDLAYACNCVASRLVQPVRASRVIGSAVVNSLTDPLTGIGNRRALDHGIEQALEAAARGGVPFSVLMLDLNDLKVLNDSYGHSLGDQAIRAVADAVQGVVRSRDVAARYGGDEFAAVLRDCGREGAERAVARLLEVTGNTSLRLPEGEVWTLSVAIGAASWPGDGASAGELLTRADARMYRHKEAIKKQEREDAGLPAVESAASRHSA
jgi:diguanylate cyclase (GGDEF)-like protein